MARSRLKQKAEFIHRGRIYQILTYSNGGQVLRRWSRATSWQVVERPSDGLWAAVDIATGKRTEGGTDGQD